MFRSSSLREKDRARAPLSNVFGTEEKRREIQKEIERAQLLIAESDDTEEEEDGSRPDGELDEGTELEKVGFPFIVEDSVKTIIIMEEVLSSAKGCVCVCVCVCVCG